MAKNKSKPSTRERLQEMFPHLTEKQLDDAEANIQRYLELVLQIVRRRAYEREQKDPHNQIGF
jgi:DNA-directed RNA polymerase specialized sigma subunit